jgi:hypothetical protein
VTSLCKLTVLLRFIRIPWIYRPRIVVFEMASRFLHNDVQIFRVGSHDVLKMLVYRKH